MTEFEQRIWRQIHSLMDGFTKWWASMRDTDTAKRATSAVHDLRDSDTAKKAASTFSDLRDSDAAKKAASTFSDLRQREPVKKAEESARKAFHDLRAGRGADAS